jgi:hypothetical protein
MSRPGHTDRTNGVPDSAGVDPRVTGAESERIASWRRQRPGFGAAGGRGRAWGSGPRRSGGRPPRRWRAGLGARMPELEPEGAGPTATASLARGSPCRCPRGSRPGVAMHSSQCRTPVGVEALEVGVGTLQGALAQRCPAPLGTSPAQPEIEVELVRLLVTARPSSAPGSHCCQRGSAYSVPSPSSGICSAPRPCTGGSRPVRGSTPTCG